MNNPRLIVATVAERFIGLREVTPNQFPGLQAFWDDTNVPQGMRERWPYCSAYATHCFVVGDKESPEIKLTIPPHFAAVAEWVPWAKQPEVGAVVFTPHDVTEELEPMAGDFVDYLNDHSPLSHCGIVVSYDRVNRIVRVAEANTDGSGGRDGDGIYHRERKLSFCGHFIRVPALAVAA